MGRPNIENLIKNEDLTPEQRRANATKAGIASGIARRAKKDFRESMRIALQELVERKDKNGNVIDKIPAQDAICVKQIAMAVAGNTKAAKFCADIVTPKRVELTGEDGQPLTSTVRYVLPEEVAEIEKHVKEVVPDIEGEV